MLHKIQVATTELGSDEELDTAAKFLKQNLAKLSEICELGAKNTISN